MGHFRCHYCEATFATFEVFEQHVTDNHLSSYDSESETDCDNDTVAPRKKDYLLARKATVERDTDDDGTDVDTVSDLVLDDDDRDEDFVPDEEETKSNSRKKSKSNSRKKCEAKRKMVKVVMEENESEEVVKKKTTLKSEKRSQVAKNSVKKASKGKEVRML